MSVIESVWACRVGQVHSGRFMPHLAPGAEMATCDVGGEESGRGRGAEDGDGRRGEGKVAGEEEGMEGEVRGRVQERSGDDDRRGEEVGMGGEERGGEEDVVALPLSIIYSKQTHVSPTVPYLYWLLR